MFLAVRRIDTLGVDFQFQTCKMFFNIFHPYDPVAYRIKSLVDKSLAELRPFLVPHHMGRKRMHLELKETMTSLESQLNSGRRIDFVLHLCYWESEDTTLMILKEIYSTMEIFADNELPQNKLYNPAVSVPSFPQYPVVNDTLTMTRTSSVPVILSGSNFAASVPGPPTIQPPQTSQYPGSPSSKKLVCTFSRFDIVRMPHEAGLPQDGNTKDFSGREYDKFKRYRNEDLKKNNMK